MNNDQWNMLTEIPKQHAWQSMRDSRKKINTILYWAAFTACASVTLVYLLICALASAMPFIGVVGSFMICPAIWLVILAAVPIIFMLSKKANS
jgi:hypothetical protein